MENTPIEILLVEDSLYDAELMMLALKRNHLANSIIHLENGAVALDFLFGKGMYAGRNIDEKPQLILLDLRLPKVNGLETLEQIRANKFTKEIPVVMLTSSTDDPEMEKAHDLGVNSYIVKSIDFANFNTRLALLSYTRGMYPKIPMGENVLKH